MTFLESDLVPLSALQHYMFCPRQCALIHVERIWVESGLTAEGRILHERVDEGGAEKRRDVKRVFGLPIRCLRLGLVGKADVVEFHRQADGSWQPYPVEHKRGRRKQENWDRVQLCAQALCLEEMLGVSVPEGALFYGKEQRREVVAISDELRCETERVAAAVHRMLAEGRTPPSEYAPKCDNCSLSNVCLPRGVGDRGNRLARSLHLLYRGQPLRYHPIPRRRAAAPAPLPPRVPRRPAWTPPPDHPWRRRLLLQRPTRDYVNMVCSDP